MHEGHRQRMLQRYLNGGLEGFEEHEIVELLLFYALPRVDTNPVAHRLIERYGSLAAVLEASPKDLEQVEGIGRNAAAFLTLLPELLRAYEKSRLGVRPVIRSIKDACDYAKALLFGKPFEQFYAVWLGTQGRVIHCERISEGSITESPVYVSKVASAALRRHAAKGFIAHNHPGGSVQPSRADIETTQSVLRALSVLGIELIDHIIVSDSQTFSFQGDALMGRQALQNDEAYAAEYAGVRQMEAVLREAERAINRIREEKSMTITFKPIDRPDPEITEGILDIEQEAFGDGALSEVTIVPLLHHGKVYVASDEEGNPVASAYFMRDMTDIGLAFLLSVAVLPDLRGHDVGTALLNYAFSHLKRFGITRVQLTVDPANFNALSAYREKLQFVVVESTQDADASGEDRLVMEKAL